MPKYQVLTNFSPFKMDSEAHPWMGWDRYHIAEEMLKDAADDFDVTEMKVYWCENRQWNHIQEKFFE